MPGPSPLTGLRSTPPIPTCNGAGPAPPIIRGVSLTPGTRLGPYEIVEPVGAGGMGEVYRARDTRLDRTVALKVLPAHLATDSAARERLEREARSVAALNHPNICTLHDVGAHEGVSFLVMEHLEGETLAGRLPSSKGRCTACRLPAARRPR